jgi:hypothetical protein
VLFIPLFTSVKTSDKDFLSIQENLEKLLISPSIYFLANEKPKQKSAKNCDEITFKWYEKTEISPQD